MAERRPRVALATCAALPRLDEDEGALIPALTRLGVEARPEVWDADGVDWAAYDLVVVRCTWDYAEVRPRFLRWAAALPRVLNACEVLDWNTDKTYLRWLQDRGIAVVPTTWLEPGSAAGGVDLAGADLVVKPAVSAGARDTARYGAADGERMRAHVATLLERGRGVMVQPYVSSIDEAGETALVFIDGTYSHAIRKGAILGDGSGGRGAAGRLFAPERTAASEPAREERALAESILEALPWPRQELLYARVDLVRDQAGVPMVLELELTEPSLFMAHGRGAVERFAEAILRRLA